MNDQVAVSDQSLIPQKNLGKHLGVSPPKGQATRSFIHQLPLALAWGWRGIYHVKRLSTHWPHWGNPSAKKLNYWCLKLSEDALKWQKMREKGRAGTRAAKRWPKRKKIKKKKHLSSAWRISLLGFFYVFFFPSFLNMSWVTIFSLIHRQENRVFRKSSDFSRVDS